MCKQYSLLQTKLTRNWLTDGIATNKTHAQQCANKTHAQLTESQYNILHIYSTMQKWNEAQKIKYGDMQIYEITRHLGKNPLPSFWYHEAFCHESVPNEPGPTQHRRVRLRLLNSLKAGVEKVVQVDTNMLSLLFDISSKIQLQLVRAVYAHSFDLSMHLSASASQWMYLDLANYAETWLPSK